MRRFLACFSRLESFVHNRYLAGFITITSGFEFSIHTRRWTPEREGMS
jgi:hypothetical protein